MANRVWSIDQGRRGPALYGTYSRNITGRTLEEAPSYRTFENVTNLVFFHVDPVRVSYIAGILLS
jgi:hypothetical protein